MTYQEFAALGYTLKKHVTDLLGNKHLLGVYPNSSGGINYFDILTEARRWMEDVKLVRAMQANDEEFLRRRKNLYWFHMGMDHLMYEPNPTEI